MPAHVGPEARISATVTHDTAEARVVPDEQPVAVSTTGHGGHRLGRGIGDLELDAALDLLHLPTGRAAQRMIALSVIARREGIEEAGDPAGKVADRREDPAHGCERPVRIDRLVQPDVVAPEVSPGQPSERNVACLVSRRRQPEGLEEPLANDVLVLLAGDSRDDPPEDAVSEVGILEPGPGHPRERETS